MRVAPSRPRPAWRLSLRAALVSVLLLVAFFGPAGPLWGVPVLLVAVLVYALGGVLAGVWRGFTFEHLRIGPIQLSRRGLRWIRPRAPGEVLMFAPPGGGRREDWRWRYAGGAGLAVTVSVLLGIGAPALTGPGRALAVSLALVLLALTALSVFTGEPSDGRRWWNLRPDGPDTAATLAVLRVSTTRPQDVPPGGWTVGDLAPLARPQTEPTLELTAALAWLDHLAAGGAPLAGTLQRLEAVRPRLRLPLQQPLVDAALAFGYAREGQPEVAAPLLERARGPLLRGGLRGPALQAELALAVARGERDTLRDLVAEARARPAAERDDAWIDRFEQEGLPDERQGRP